MFKRILLLLCIAFVVVCYGYPCLILPFGEYKGEWSLFGAKYEVTYSFNFNGKVKTKQKITNGGTSTEENKEYYYKLSGNYVIISEDETFDDSDTKAKINTLYQFNNCQNMVGMFVAIGVGVLAVVLVLIPDKRR